MNWYSSLQLVAVRLASLLCNELVQFMRLFYGLGFALAALELALCLSWYA